VERAHTQEIASFLREAEYRLQSSLTTARDLLASDFAGPSFAWSVRSVEIFLKYFVLAPLYYAADGDGSNWMRAVKKASAKFRSSNWAGAMKEVERTCGTLDPLLMEDGEDAYKYWRKKPVVYRGSVIHGEQEGDRAAAQAVLVHAEQMIVQLKLRLLTSGTHPFSDVFKEQLRRVWAVPGNSMGEGSSAS
jgi:hypothetical protein